MSPPYFVVVQNPLRKRLVQHLPVPFLQSLRFWDLLVRRMAVENVVVSFARWTRPDVALGIPTGIHRPNMRPEGHLPPSSHSSLQKLFPILLLKTEMEKER